MNDDSAQWRVVYLETNQDKFLLVKKIFYKKCCISIVTGLYSEQYHIESGASEPHDL